MPDDPSSAPAIEEPLGGMHIGSGAEGRKSAGPPSSLLAEPDIAQTELNDGSVRLQLRRRRAARENAPAAVPQREAARLITMAWGDSYIEELLSVTVPALLAPGNLPAFAEDFDVEFVMVTETRLFELVSRKPVILSLLECCDVRLVPIDDLLSPWYGITLTFALLRGFADLGSDMVGAHLLFINTDFVLADGSYRNLAKMILRGERLVVSPSHCMVYEDTIDVLRARYDQTTCSLSIGHRELAAMVLHHRHNTVRAKTVNQQLFRLHWHDQFYWYVDEHTLLARQFPIAVVYMRPERVVTELPTFWDYGMISEICPTARPCVLGDSDEFLMAEMRGRDTLSSLLRLGWPSIDELANDLSRYLTRDHHDLGQYTLTLHSADVPEQLATEKAQFDTFMTELYRRLSPPRSYRDHPFWLEGWDRFRMMRAEAGTALQLRLRVTAALRERPAYTKRAQRLASLRAQIAQAERQMAFDTEPVRREQARLRDLLRSAERAQERRRKSLQELQKGLQREIAELAFLQQQEFDGAYAAAAQSPAAGPSVPIEASEEDPATLEDFDGPTGGAAPGASGTSSDLAWMEEVAREGAFFGAGKTPAAAPPPGGISGVRGRIAQTYRAMFGRLPHTTLWHPYHTSLRHVRVALKAVIADGAATMLFIASEDPLAPLLVSDLPISKTTITPGALTRDALDVLGGDVPQFDCCFCYLGFDELSEFREIMDKIRPVMRRGSRIVVFQHNRDFHALNEHTFAFTSTLFPIIGKSRISFTGSLPAALAVRWFVRSLTRRRTSRLSGLVSLAAALFICAPLARLAGAIEEKQDPRSYPKHCTGMTIEIELV
ncbi:MAG: hypothetical protein ACLQJR_33655 [Stellaceae bacterium]